MKNNAETASSTILPLLLICLAAVLVSANNGLAQNANPAKETSKIEAFAARDGILLKKEFTDLGKFRGCEVNTLQFTDMMSGQKSSGVRFSVSLSTQYTSSEKSAFLDPDELGALLSAIQIITTSVLTQVPAVYTEIVFQSRGGFKAGCYYDKNGKWQGFLQIDPYDTDTHVWFDADRFGELVALLQTAKGQLTN